MREDTWQWLKEAPVEQLQCRELRHAWPRGMSRRTRGLESSANIAWQIVTRKGDGTPREIERTMACVGGCGVTRVESFLVDHDGSLHRDGKPRYRHPQGYLRKRQPDGPDLEPIGTDEVRGIVVRRLYPNLAW